MRKVRLQRTVAAGLSGAALGLCGAQMQTIFRNPLADPFVLGITAGASFGVAIVVLAAGTGSSQWIGGLDVAGKLGISGAAFAGAIAVTLVALAVSHRVRGTASILVVGLMIGYLLAALVSLLVAGADPARLRQFVTWGFGSFRGVTNAELKVMAPVLIAGIGVSLLSTKTLNALLLGERYAESMGVAVRRDRLLILLVTSMLAGVVTAFVGPVAFVGVAAPHLARPLVGHVGPSRPAARVGDDRRRDGARRRRRRPVARTPRGPPSQRRHRPARCPGSHLGAHPPQPGRGDHVSRQ